MREAVFARGQITCSKYGTVRDRAQRQNNARARTLSEFCAQILVACLDLDGQRFVGWRQALHGVGDADIQQLKAVVGGRGYRAGSQSVFMQGPVKQYAG